MRCHPAGMAWFSHQYQSVRTPSGTVWNPLWYLSKYIRNQRQTYHWFQRRLCDCNTKRILHRLGSVSRKGLLGDLHPHFDWPQGGMQHHMGKATWWGHMVTYQVAATLGIASLHICLILLNDFVSNPPTLCRRTNRGSIEDWQVCTCFLAGNLRQVMSMCDMPRAWLYYILLSCIQLFFASKNFSSARGTSVRSSQAIPRCPGQ